jgi:hypothetical protein
LLRGSGKFNRNHTTPGRENNGKLGFGLTGYELKGIYLMGLDDESKE